MAFCVIIPAYNAGNTIGDIVREVCQLGIPVLAVDDGSTDGTAGELQHLPVNVITHNWNQGKGAALRTGFAWALKHGFSGVVTLDADGQHDPQSVGLLARTAMDGGIDILIA